MNTTAVVIVAICAWALVSIVTAAKDKSKSKKDIRSDKAMEAENAALRERVEVLEKIVTEENYDLKKQFKDLESGKVA